MNIDNSKFRPNAASHAFPQTNEPKRVDGRHGVPVYLATKELW
jgi:hypothetical protein